MIHQIKITNKGDLYQFYEELMGVFQDQLGGDISIVKITLNDGDSEEFNPQSISCNSIIELPENLIINRGYISYTDEILREIYKESLEDIKEVKIILK